MDFYDGSSVLYKDHSRRPKAVSNIPIVEKLKAMDDGRLVKNSDITWALWGGKRNDREDIYAATP